MLARLALLLLALAAPAAMAQPDPKPPASERVWYAAGVGAASGGTGLAAHWTLVTGRHAFSLRSALSFSLLGELVGAIIGRDGGSAYDFGLLYGRPLVDTQQTFVSVGAGVGLVQRMRDEGPAALGLPLEVQATARLTSWFGIGVYGFGNVNRMRSFGGVALALQVGQLW